MPKRARCASAYSGGYSSISVCLTSSSGTPASIRLSARRAMLTQYSQAKPCMSLKQSTAERCEMDMLAQPQAQNAHSSTSGYLWAARYPR